MWFFLLYSACHLNLMPNLWLDVWECFSAFYTAAISLSLGKITLPSNICYWEGCLRHLTPHIWEGSMLLVLCCFLWSVEPFFRRKRKGYSCDQAWDKNCMLLWMCAKGWDSSQRLPVNLKMVQGRALNKKHQILLLQSSCAGWGLRDWAAIPLQGHCV